MLQNVRVDHVEGALTLEITAKTIGAELVAMVRGLYLWQSPTYLCDAAALSTRHQTQRRPCLLTGLIGLRVDPPGLREDANRTLAAV